MDVERIRHCGDTMKAEAPDKNRNASKRSVVRGTVGVIVGRRQRFVKSIARNCEQGNVADVGTVPYDSDVEQYVTIGPHDSSGRPSTDSKDERTS